MFTQQQNEGQEYINAKFKSNKEACYYYYFDMFKLANSKEERKQAIDVIVSTSHMKRTVVQSYASNYMKSIKG